jgi:hypothetical protein
MGSPCAEADALRIQAAAVAAEQAVLWEEERRLRQHGSALQHQEAQLGALLEDKRRRLLVLWEEVRQARDALRAEQATHRQSQAQAARDLDTCRADLVAEQEEVHTRRRRLLRLRDRLRRRWRRHWAAERAAMRQREAALEQEAGNLRTRLRQLERDREAFEEFRLRGHGEIELGRRELLEAWGALRQHEVKFREQAAALARREAALARGERELARRQQHWQAGQADRDAEQLGLENRIRNQRQKLRSLEQEQARLGDRLPLTPPGCVPTALPVQVPVAVPAELSASAPGRPPPSAEDGLSGAERAALLDLLAEELADQRLHLAEQCARFRQTQDHWRQDQAAAAAAVQGLADRLREREERLAAAEDQERSRSEEIDRQYRLVHGLEVQWAARLTGWYAERDRLVAELRAREELLDHRWARVDDLTRRWQERYQGAARRLKAEYARCEGLFQELVTLRQRLLQAPTSPSEARSPGGDPAATEGSLHASREECRAEERARRLRQWADELASRDAELVNLQTAWERGRAAAEAEAAALRREAHALRYQQAAYERQVKGLEQEVERLARLLIAGAGPDPSSVQRAA